MLQAVELFADFHGYSRDWYENGERFPCENCGKVYKHRGNMRRHVMYECGKTAQFPCPHCWRKFHQQSNLRRHCISQHAPRSSKYKHFSYHNSSQKDLKPKFPSTIQVTRYRVLPSKRA